LPWAGLRVCVCEGEREKESALARFKRECKRKCRCAKCESEPTDLPRLH